MTRRVSAGLSRRRFVLGAASAAAIGLAGCTGSTDRPEPIALTGDKSCDQCGMIIDQHPGPSGQTYYRDNSPEDHDPPAWFCSTVCTYRHRFETSNRGWQPQVTYLTDYAIVDYSVDREGGTQVLSAHLAAENFAATDGLEVVIGSEVEGAMGPAIVPFSDTDAAEEFASTYGGEIVAAENISRELVAQQ
ncbi:nitrous oxide reductase accessory protein NosL [Haloplanus aerogenes]|uniref:Nitrous oxide reductase accessory protein NosL n=1 Tax=Haloplanus aerogenes TaxID=660522 RepID=A0A3M0DTG2_9EURY|nr:nitrous oxide reductase accessory protein NosL [Haloplanus aerogenes]AZH25655.1 nitrous oxide reductase accessory protein NosL [Haloplanus aerogenes]RMB25384.1 nitrous oxide reductase accessory protein NosL [Haloplanus aerogenes]